MDGLQVIVLSRRLRLPGVLESMNDQAPEIRAALAKMIEELPAAMATLGGSRWAVSSHSVTIHNGLIIATFLVSPSGYVGR